MLIMPSSVINVLININLINVIIFKALFYIYSHYNLNIIVITKLC